MKRYFIEKNYRGILNLNMPKPAEHLSFAQLKVKRLGLQHYDNAIQEMRDPSGHLGFWLSGKALSCEDPETDVYWAHRGYPTLTPITWDQTEAGKMDEAMKIVPEAEASRVNGD